MRLTWGLRCTKSPSHCFPIGRDNALPLEIWRRLRRGITPEIDSIASLIFAVSVALIVIWYRIRTRGLGSEAQQLMENR